MSRTMSPSEFGDAFHRAPKAFWRVFGQMYPDYIMKGFHGRMARTRLRGRPGLESRSRALTLSFKNRSYRRGTARAVYIAYSDSPYARIHEKGGTITAKKKYLAIPLSAAQTGGGRAKGKRGGAGLTRATPRSFADTFVAESKNKNLIIFQKTGKKRPKNLREGQKDPTIRPLFVLKKSVEIPARLGYFDTWERDAPARARTLRNIAVKALRETFG